jgi:hypothetical protein
VSVEDSSAGRQCRVETHGPGPAGATRARARQGSRQRSAPSSLVALTVQHGLPRRALATLHSKRTPAC